MVTNRIRHPVLDGDFRFWIGGLFCKNRWRESAMKVFDEMPRVTERRPRLEPLLARVLAGRRSADVSVHRHAEAVQLGCEAEAVPGECVFMARKWKFCHYEIRASQLCHPAFGLRKCAIMKPRTHAYLLFCEYWPKFILCFSLPIFLSDYTPAQIYTFSFFFSVLLPPSAPPPSPHSASHRQPLPSPARAWLWPRPRPLTGRVCS